MMEIGDHSNKTKYTAVHSWPLNAAFLTYKLVWLIPQLLLTIYENRVEFYLSWYVSNKR